MRSGTVLSFALLSTACASLPTAPAYTRPGMLLGDRPPIAGARPVAQGPGDGRPGASASPPRNSAAEGAPQTGTLARQAVLGTVDEVRASMAAAASGLSALAAHTRGIGGGANGIFSRHLVYGSGQLPWLQDALASSRAPADAAAGVEDADMELAILRMAGPPLQAATSGTLLLAAWVDFLSLADAILQHCLGCSVEKLFVDMNRVQRLMEPSMAALSSQDPEQVEAVAIALPELMGKLTNE